MKKANCKVNVMYVGCAEAHDGGPSLCGPCSRTETFPERADLTFCH